MELGGLSPGNGTGYYDQIIVNGQLTYGGSLTVSLVNGFTPSYGNSFDLFNWTTRTGDFSSTSFPSLATGLAWNISNLDTDGSIRVDHAWHIALTNNTGSTLGPQVGDILTTGHDGYYNSSILDLGTPGDDSGYANLLGSLHTPSNDGPTFLLADLNGTQADINTLLANLYAQDNTPGFTIFRAGDFTFDSAAELYSVPGRSWDALFAFSSLPLAPAPAILTSVGTSRAPTSPSANSLSCPSRTACTSYSSPPSPPAGAATRAVKIKVFTQITTRIVRGEYADAAGMVQIE